MFAVTDVFHGSPDCDVFVVPRNEIDLGCAERDAKLRRCFDEEHLAFSRGYGNASEFGGPRSAGVDKVRRTPFAASGLYKDGVELRRDGGDGGLLKKIDAGAFCSLGQRDGKIARVEALFIEKEEFETVRLKARRERMNEVRAELFHTGWDCMTALQRLPCADWNFPAGEFFNSSEKLRVEPEAELAEWAERGGILRVGGGEHSRCGPGAFTHGVASVEDDDLQAGGRKFECGREADDSCACDDCVGVVHEFILCCVPGMTMREGTFCADIVRGMQ